MAPLESSSKSQSPLVCFGYVIAASLIAWLSASLKPLERYTEAWPIVQELWTFFTTFCFAYMMLLLLNLYVIRNEERFWLKASRLALGIALLSLFMVNPNTDNSGSFRGTVSTPDPSVWLWLLFAALAPLIAISLSVCAVIVGKLGKRNTLLPLAIMTLAALIEIAVSIRVYTHDNRSVFGDAPDWVALPDENIVIWNCAHAIPGAFKHLLIGLEEQWAPGTWINYNQARYKQYNATKPKATGE
jgi:hypothetical protein